MNDSLKVLNIEDSEDDALLVQRELRRSGFNIIWERVETAEALGAALEKQTWDVIISDYNLPKFNAADALQIVKSRHPNLPFIVVSGIIGETAAVELMRAGAQDYLMKGSLARLSEAVRREVRDAENRVERQRSQLELDLVKERLQLAVEGSGIGLWDWAIQTDEVIINEQLAKIFGYSLAELEQFGTQTWWQLNHSEDSQKAKLAIESHFQQKTLVYECELRKRHKSGSWVWVLSRGKVLEWDADGKPLRMTGTILDISDRKQTEMRVQMQNTILERIAKGEPLPDILDAIVRAMEDQIEGAVCSILLCDRQGKLRYGAAPNLPNEYIKAIEGITISEGASLCGTVAFRKEPMIVFDIATDPLWQDYKEFVLAYNLRSCWAYPTIATNGSVLATLSVYYHDVQSPQPQELEVIEIATNIVKIAIEREQATQVLEQLNSELEDRVEARTEALRQSETKLNEAQQIAHLGSWEIDLLSQKLIWSAEVFKIFGLDPNQPEPTYAEMLQYYPLEERKRVIDFVNRAMQGQPCETDFQIIRADGSSVYTFAKAEPILDAAGQAIGLFGIVMDISDRKAIQEALKRSEERTRATLLALPDLVFRVDREGKYVDFMTSPEEGNLVDPHQVIGKSIYDDLPMDISEDHADTKYNAIQQALTTQTVQVYEQQVNIADKLRYEEVRVAPCSNDEVVFFVRDISDRKQAENTLRESQALLQTVLDAFPLSVFWKDRQSVLLGCNQLFAVTCGMQSSLEAIGKNVFEFSYTNDEALGYLADDQQVMESGLAKLNIEEKITLAPGEQQWLQTNKVPLRDSEGNVIGVMGTFQDISDRKSAEEIIRQQAKEEKVLLEITQRIRQSLDLHTIFDTACEEIRQLIQSDRVGIFKFDPESNFDDGEFVAESFVEGLSSVLEIKIHDHCFGEKYAPLYQQGRYAAMDDIYQLERCHTDVLALFQVRSNLVVPLLCGNQLWGLLCVHQCFSSRHWQPNEIDLTQQIANQLAIAIQQASLFEQLQQKLAEQEQSELQLTATNQQLAISNQELARATRLKDEFLANMSHELRTPLNAILGMTEGLQEKVFGSINDFQLRALQTIESSGTHLLELINDILDVAKISSGQLELDFAPTSINHLCQSSLTFIKQQATHKRIQIHTKFQSNSLDLLVDERRIRQVLINLLSNAVKFTPEGGSITLEVSHHPPLTADAESSNGGNLDAAKGFLEIAVIDTGIGIASADLQKLFKPFVQIDSALNRQYNGTGLGLALVKQIIELHGGQVELTSELGVGSRFSIKLPYVPNMPLPLETIASNNQEKSLLLESPKPSEIKSPLILFAEDNEANTMTISSYLVAKGYRIVLATDGQQAIAVAMSAKPDVILMDIQMPIMDGLEAIKQIRLDPNLANIPIIALTALAMEGDRGKCLEVGANDYITKPVSLRNLFNTIQELLRSLK